MDTNPVSAETLFYEGTRLQREGDVVGAERAFRQALELAPDLAEVHANLGLLLEDTGRWVEAEVCYRRALELAPWQIQIHLNFGALLSMQKRFAEAEASYRQALVLDAESPSAWSNLGVLLACIKREKEAEQCYRTALALVPDHRNAAFNLAYLLLRQGRYEEGWRRFESRNWFAQLEKNLPIPRWQGESLVGKSVLIGVEAGHGDMIQFCRYASLLKKQGVARLTMLCHPGLKTLFSNLVGIDEAIAFTEPIPNIDWDCWVPPLSLPFGFQTRLETIPAEIPYLRVAPERIERWAGVMESGGQEMRVGLVWKGNPRFENDADRSLDSLDALAPLGDVAEVRYFSLQKGAGETEAQRPPKPLAMVDLGSRMVDFSDTAAIVMNLDLVIAVDTAVVHLAGALGKPCWVLLPDYKPDWRWLADRDDSPWYPGVIKIYRQQTAGDWATVIARVRTDLQRLVAARKQAPLAAG